MVRLVSLRVISVKDLVAYQARLLLDLDASVPVPAKHAHDYMRLAELVKSSNMEAAWSGSSEANPPDDIQRDEHINQRVDCNSPKSPDQS